MSAGTDNTWQIACTPFINPRPGFLWVETLTLKGLKREAYDDNKEIFHKI